MRAGNLYQPIKELLDAGGLAELGPNHRATAWSIDRLEKSLSIAFQDIRLTPALKDLLRAGIYLWHDHLDEAHRITQEIETPDESLWHAIMHRREPDYGNSKYWFRRVGAHPSFLALATGVGELLQKHNESDLQSRLLPNKTWDPFVFIDAVEEASSGQFRSKSSRLQEIQKLEFSSFFENLINRI